MIRPDRRPTIRASLGSLVNAGSLLLPLALAGGALSGCVVRVDSDDYKTREERRFKVSGVPDIRLTTFDGSIAVRGWDRDEVYVEVEKRGREQAETDGIEVLWEQEGSGISVEARQPSPKKYGFGVVSTISRSARIMASVPVGSNVMVHSGDGSLNLERISGRLELRTSDGNVTGLDLQGDVFVSTDDGGIKLEGVDGRCDVGTGDGNITLLGRLDALRAKSLDGTILVKALPGSRPESEWSLGTGEGGLVMYLPEEFAADIDAETGDGRIKIDPALSAVTVQHRADGALRASIGGGGTVVRLRTRDGSITFKRLHGRYAEPVVKVER